VKIKAKSRPAVTDVALAQVDTYIPYSHNVITLRDFSVFTKENLLPKRADHVTTKSNNIGELKFTNTFSEIEVTDTFGFNIDTFVSNPLWYKYTLSFTHNNQTKQSNRRNQRADITTGNVRVDRLTSDKQQILLSNSTSIRYTDDQAQSIDYNEATEGSRFIIDYARRDLTYIAANFSGLDLQGTLNVRFNTIENSILVDIEDTEDYLMTAKEIDNNTYVITIFSTNNNPVLVKYAANKDGEIEEVEELTSFEPIYLESDNNTNTTQSKSFSVNNELVKLKSSNTFQDYAIRQKILTNTKIFTVPPFALPRQESWFLRVSENEFTKDALTYKVNNTSPFINRPNRKYEQPIIVDANHIQLSQIPLYARTKSAIEGITITTIDDITLTVTNVNDSTGIITIQEQISTKDFVTAVYDYEDDLILLNEYDFNPRNSTRKDFHIMKMISVIFILPQEELIDPNRSVFVGYLHRYKGGHEIEYTDANIISFMDSDNVHPLISEHVNTTDIHPIVLSTLAVDSEFLPKRAIMKDVRVRGGGVHSQIQHLNKNVADDIFQMLDIGNWDGETFDLSGVIIFRVPLNVRQSIENVFRFFDQDVIFNKVDIVKERLIQQKTDDFFRDVIDKRKPLGKRALIEYLEV